VKQRDLLNAWLRAAVKLRTLPVLEDYQPDRIVDERADMMGFDVAGEADNARFLITHEGTRLTATYGNDDVDPDKRTNRYLDDAIGPERYARVVAPYRVCLMRKRPTYSVSKVQDPDGKDVSYERLLLPFGNADAVEQIIGSYKSISIEGNFKINKDSAACVIENTTTATTNPDTDNETPGITHAATSNPIAHDPRSRTARNRICLMALSVGRGSVPMKDRSQSRSKESAAAVQAVADALQIVVDALQITLDGLQSGK